MKKYIVSGVLTFLFLGVVLVPNTQPAQAATTAEMIAQIKVLMEQLQSLQTQLAALRGDVKDALKSGLTEGMSDEDIKKIQQLLGTDPTIYPEGKMTGYYGPLTREAIKRFQNRHGLEVTGVVDEETRDLLEEYLGEKYNGAIPPGLLRAPGIMKKIEDRFWTKCKEGRDHGHGNGKFCKKLKGERGNSNDDHEEDAEDEEDDHGHDGEEDEDEDEDHHHGTTTSNTTYTSVDVEVDNGSTTVTFKQGSTAYEVEVHSTSQSTVLAAVADELDVTVANLNAKLVKDIKSKLAKAVADDSDTLEEDAQDAIDDAQDAIDDAENEIEDASGTTTEAESILEDAQDKLDDAENAFDDEDYAEAEELAKEAEELAQDAIDAL